MLPKDEWHIKIREFLYEQLEHERALTAVIMIHTLNKNKEKASDCILNKSNSKLLSFF